MYGYIFTSVIGSLDLGKGSIVKYVSFFFSSSLFCVIFNSDPCFGHSWGGGGLTEHLLSNINIITDFLTSCSPCVFMILHLTSLHNFQNFKQ
jgi:hypothetical protein